uniref:Uncharacterized protein n=1 Tax=Mycena chlorophos TaxID=658473 RepID=A0ABQ0LEU0_MYCCL|nr:predicted protein [Mycena chlorophos]
MFPVHLSASSPRKRGPRREDVEHFINECRTPFEPWNSNSSPPLYRSLGPNVQYFPGALTGRWKGSSITPSINDYAHWKDADAVPESMDVFCRQPLYLTLQEHFCYDAAVRQDEDAPCLPLAGTWVEREDGITVDSWGPREFERHRGAPQREIFDVFVTGKTDDPYASAWGDFRIVGRVRLSDGLVVLSRESVAGLGTTVFRGYMTSPQNFCGRYRAVGGALHADWEAAFSLCKM